MAVSKRIRTDLALETTERFKEENTEIRGVEIQGKPWRTDTIQCRA